MGRLQNKALRFRQFTRKGYALFACLGRVVTIGVLRAPENFLDMQILEPGPSPTESEALWLGVSNSPFNKLSG